MPLKEQKDNQVFLNIEPRLVNAETAAKFLGISSKLFWRLDREGRVPAPIRFGTRKVWDVRELGKWIEAGCKNREQWQKLKTKSK